MKFSEWMLMKENDDDLGLDLSMDMDMDTDVPPARPQAARPQVPRPQVQAPRPQAPSSSINVPSGEFKFGGGNGKFLRGTKGVHDVKKKIYKISSIRRQGVFGPSWLERASCEGSSFLGRQRSEI